MDIDARFFALTDGLSATEKRAWLCQDLGIIDRSLQVDSADSILDPTKRRVATTAVDACVRLFAKPYTNVVAAIPTWTNRGKDLGGDNDAIDHLRELNIAMLTDGGKALKAILWPFLIDNHFVLCVIRPNLIATILDSMGTVEAHINVVKTALAESAWKEWKVVVGVSGTQNMTCDSGIFCIANAAYTIAEHPLTTTMNADFWRTVCWCLIELAKDNKHFATSVASADLPGCSTPAVSQAVRQTKYDEGLAVLNMIIDGPPNKWWDYWEDKVLTLVRAFGEFHKARSTQQKTAQQKNPRLQKEVAKMRNNLIEMMDSAERYERCSQRTRQELAVQMGAHEMLMSVVSHMENLLNGIKLEVPDVPGA